MLSGLSIRNIVLIEALDLDLAAGLTALTGETGAGKSILLDSLLLALGRRADRAMVRTGADRGSVTAEFTLASDHKVFALLQDEGLDDGDSVILRRHVTPDGRSKAWVNDQPVSLSRLAAISEHLVELHGQHDDRGLLSPASHRGLLDHYGGHRDLVSAVTSAYGDLQALQQRRDDIMAAQAAAAREEDYLRHAAGELDALGAVPGEETALADQRASMMRGEKLATDLSDIRSRLYRDAGLEADIRGLARRIDRLSTDADGLLEPVSEALDRAAIELEEAGAAFNRAEQALDFDPAELERVEERLFELRRLARKHDVAADALSDLADTLHAQLQALDRASQDLVDLDTAIAAADAAFASAAAALRRARLSAAQRLDGLVQAELPPLKLENATFRTVIADLDRAQWSAAGSEQVHFEVQTNPSSGFGALTKIASGGELARFILALKVVLAESDQVPTMVFDEVDRGIGGATAAAVGERLARLADHGQVLLVTHSPQVAATAAHHLHIQKSSTGGVTRTDLVPLDVDDRVEEIARMLAGAELTSAARDAARALMGSLIDGVTDGGTDGGIDKGVSASASEQAKGSKR